MANSISIDESILRPHILEMESYTPIMPFEVLSAQLGIPAEQIIKLDANENPYGILPEVAEALAAIPYPHIYPDPESRLLRQEITQAYQVPFDNILAGAGADELIDLIMRVVLDPGDRIVNCPPTFGMYAFDAGVNAAGVISVPRQKNFELDIDGIITAVEQHKPKLLFLANPNNPDGGVVAPEIIEQLLELPLLVVLDEAYMDFTEAGRSMITPLGPIVDGGRIGDFSDISTRKEFVSTNKTIRNNLIILRTFSKRAGLAGLRVGFGVFPDWLMPHLWKVKQPYNVSVAAATAAITALENGEKLEQQGTRIITERNRLFEELEQISWLKPYPSEANFILCQVNGRDAGQLKANLAQQGILIRYFNKPGLQDHIRISVGRPEQTDALLAAVREIGNQDREL